MLAISYEVTTPPTKLMFDFVDYFIGKSVVLHANTKDMKMDLLTVVKEVNKLEKYATMASYNKCGRVVTNFLPYPKFSKSLLS